MAFPLALLASVALTLGITEWRAHPAREVEFPFQDDQRLQAGEANAGKLWRSRGLPDDGTTVPLVVFVHGIIFDGQRHHWLTTDPAGPWDARPFMDALVDAGALPPLVVAVPSQTRDAQDPAKLFVGIDFDAFVEATDRALDGHQRVDRARIVVIGHSGSACDPDAAAFAALRAKTFTPRALLAIDGCLAPSTAKLLAATSSARDVIVSYQDLLWSERPFLEFRRSFEGALQTAWPRGLRVLERHEPIGENPHLALVEDTVRRWLPRILPPDRLAWTASLHRDLPSLPVLSSLF